MEVRDLIPKDVVDFPDVFVLLISNSLVVVWKAFYLTSFLIKCCW